MRLFRAILLLVFTAPLITGIAQVADLTPGPQLSPEQVVQYQINALQRNDQPRTDAGIERAFLPAPSRKCLSTKEKHDNGRLRFIASHSYRISYLGIELLTPNHPPTHC